MNKLTDAEIVKALECCLSSNDLVACWKCPAVKFDICCDGSSKISNGITDKVIDLINRQRGEMRKKQVKIHHLLKELNQVQDYYEIQKAEIELKTMDIESLTNERKALEEMVAEQKAEIERLTIENLQMVASIKNLKTEAINDFIKKAKTKQEFLIGEDNKYKGYVSIEDLESLKKCD